MGTMNSAQNQAAYRRMKAALAEKYPRGRFLAIEDGQVIADAASFGEMKTALAALGKESRNMLIVQAGDDTPEFAYILLGGRSS